MPKFYLLNDNGCIKATYDEVWSNIVGNFVHFTAVDGGRTIAIARLAPGERVEREPESR